MLRLSPWAPVAAVAVAFASFARDAHGTEDGRPPTTSALSPDMPGASAREGPAPSGNLIRLNHIGQLPKATRFLSGLDLDGDGKREFLMRAPNNTLMGGGVIQFYENTADDTFALVHAIEIVWEDNPDSPFTYYAPGDAGDGDGRTPTATLGDLVKQLQGKAA